MLISTLIPALDMAEQDKGIDYYRQFFVDPRRPVDPLFTASSQFLADKLLGKSDGQSPQLPEGEYSGFVRELAKRMQGARCFDERSIAQLHPSGFIPAILAHEASTLRNNNTVARQSSPEENTMEEEVIQWIIKEIGRFDNPENARGSITTGGTLSNLTALLAARERMIDRKEWKQGESFVVLTSEMSHYSVTKAANILAPEEKIRVVNVPLERSSYRMDIDKLKDLVGEHAGRVMAIVANAGQTETGQIDDLAKIAEIARERGLFLHVDGAYGAPFVLSRQADLFRGMEQATTLSVDPHKYLYTPYPAGVILHSSAQTQEYIRKINGHGGDAYLFSQGDAGGR